MDKDTSRLAVREPPKTGRSVALLLGRPFPAYLYEGGTIMDTTASVLTILFQEPFWVGIFERSGSGQYEVCKITFGPEPTNQEVLDFLLKHHHELRFSPSIPADVPFRRSINPKRAQRMVRKEQRQAGIGTKAQQALKLQQEQGREARKNRSREQREAEARRRFALRTQKRKEKHKGH